jgi:hypothetical protein
MSIQCRAAGLVWGVIGGRRLRMDCRAPDTPETCERVPARGTLGVGGGGVSGHALLARCRGRRLGNHSACYRRAPPSAAARPSERAPDWSPRVLRARQRYIGAKYPRNAIHGTRAGSLFTLAVCGGFGHVRKGVQPHRASVDCSRSRYRVANATHAAVV